ncbi:MAG: NAD(P)/FAD-dependent oxidoreductase [candidate division NC10 bacterium]|nr:NAD(P)/FAD-dependent oxidoreductase [candidate division NC10 bacterium]
MIDVIVVGGGPVGCYAAFVLAGEGIEVLVLEEHPAIGYPVDCSGVVGAEAFDAFDLSREPILDEVRMVRLISPSGESLSYRSAEPFAYVTDRAAFDQVIARKALDVGAVIQTGCRVVDLRPAQAAIEVVIEEERRGAAEGRYDGKGGQRTFLARMAILAGGPWYKLQEKLGMGTPKALLRTAQAEMEVVGLPEAQVLFGRAVAPGSFAWFLPFRREGHLFARVGVSSREPALPYFKQLHERFRASGYLADPAPSARAWVIPIAPLSRTVADRVLAVGDAAGQTKPTTGGGLFYGLLCAQFAAGTAAEAFRAGDFSARFLERYEKRWRQRLGPELKVASFFRGLFERMTDTEIDQCFQIVGTDGLLGRLSRRVHFDWHKDVILTMLRQPALARIFFRGLFR